MRPKKKIVAEATTPVTHIPPGLGAAVGRPARMTTGRIDMELRAVRMELNAIKKLLGEELATIKKMVETVGGRRYSEQDVLDILTEALKQQKEQA